MISDIKPLQKSHTKRRGINSFIFAVISLAIACNNAKPVEPSDINAPVDQPKLIHYRVLNIFPHDTAAYTEGFLFHNNQLFESTGHTSSFPSSRSLFGVVDLKTGYINAKVELDKNNYFGEGIVFLMGRVYQLTDTTRIGF
ncbi:MAG TPA: glutaminyl-peptide cyclotransferase, partial [Puia sp.]